MDRGFTKLRSELVHRQRHDVLDENDSSGPLGSRVEGDGEGYGESYMGRTLRDNQQRATSTGPRATSPVPSKPSRTRRRRPDSTMSQAGRPSPRPASPCLPPGPIRIALATNSTSPDSPGCTRSWRPPSPATTSSAAPGRPHRRHGPPARGHRERRLRLLRRHRPLHGRPPVSPSLRHLLTRHHRHRARPVVSLVIGRGHRLHTPPD